MSLRKLQITHLIRRMMINHLFNKLKQVLLILQASEEKMKILHSKSLYKIKIIKRRIFLRQVRRLSIQMSQMNCQTKKSQMKEIKQKILLEMKLKKRRNLMLSMKSLLNKIPLIKKRIRVIPWLIPLLPAFLYRSSRTRSISYFKHIMKNQL